MRNKLVELILDRRNRPDAIKDVLKAETKRKDRQQNTSNRHHRRRLGGDGGGYDLVRGVYRGNYFRIKIPNNVGSGKPSELPKIPVVAPPPSFAAIVNTTAGGGSTKDGGGTGDYLRWMIEWFQQNWPTLLLNFGSVCTLAAFTRSDVLELRSLSATGSICNALFHWYNPASNFSSILWPGIFASVNGYKIGEIIVERNADVHMTEEQETIYVEHFLPHGVTPKMFELLSTKAEKFEVEKHGVMIRKGDVVDHVYLVVSGSTSASILGRYLTSHSTSSEKRSQPDRMHSGTWIGEMNYLDWAWEENQPITPPGKKLKEQKDGTAVNSTDSSINNRKLPVVVRSASNSINTNKDPQNMNQPTIQQNSSDGNPDEENSRKHRLVDSLYTIVAKEDCVVWRWSFEEMQQLMNRSTDMRGSLTRAMTSAITAKVVNLTLNRATHLPTWSTWLSDWTRDDGAS
eukprot:CAMPEP_0113504176 /NCGR_PEP_ID=MMETSP0014_2-20120614/34576_1 /TAXON_ID=2857 /ORGANISM="Nitzschia sp." /LENGTH=457 /DNA_ID=CAMNT_0000399269 /DNA_START=187 /DNA_END=1556 /DNA_ORIENTATION=- /assembly_acc=CAM_ASM_000159